MAHILPFENLFISLRNVLALIIFKQNKTALHYIMFTLSDPEVEEHTPSTFGTKYSAPSTSKVKFEDSDDSVPVFWNEWATKILLTEVKQREEASNKGKIADVLKKKGFYLLGNK